MKASRIPVPVALLAFLDFVGILMLGVGVCLGMAFIG
jgi:hypothetical protein